MPEESTTPDLVERWRQAAEAVDRRDFDAAMSFFAPDAVWEEWPLGFSFEGAAAIRGFLEDWRDEYEEYEQEMVEGRYLGSKVVFVVLRQDARPVGGPGRVQELWAFTTLWTAGMTVRVMTSRDIDEARAAAERLAQERADV